jgi:hypothetical protein
MGEEAEQEIGRDLVTLDQAVRMVAQERIGLQDWSGLPLPVPGLSLVLEPRYKHPGIADFRWKECYDEHGTRQSLDESPPSEPSEYRRVNSWWNEKYQARVIVLHDKQGRARAGLSPEDRLSFTIRTLDAAVVWPIEAEQKAQQKLSTLIPSDSFQLYQLTGHFAELSKRSQVTYMFRRGRPTIAIRQNEAGGFPLCALCLHPIGYYADTWAGVMCPTDEVIAHLLMMRGSEEKYWANANQHPVDHPAAGI